MALIECRECGEDISEKAENCPSCGDPVEPSRTLGWWLISMDRDPLTLRSIIGLVLAAIILWATGWPWF